MVNESSGFADGAAASLDDFYVRYIFLMASECLRGYVPCLLPGGGRDVRSVGVLEGGGGEAGKVLEVFAERRLV